MTKVGVGSPGLMVIGEDSHPKDHGFESRQQILDGHFFTYIVVKSVKYCLKRQKINYKEAGDGPFFKNNDQSLIVPKEQTHQSADPSK